MRARIYQKSGTAMQAGRAESDVWVLEYPRSAPATPNVVMGWASSGDVARLVRLEFASAEAARAHAEANGIAYTMIARPARNTPRRRSHDENFAHDRREAWTH